MEQTRIRRNTWIFAAFLLLAGVAYLLTRSWEGLFRSTLLFCLNFAIYVGLLLFWMQSVRERLLPTGARKTMLAAAMLMLLYLLLRAFKYRIAGGAVMLRYIVYAYYVPMTLIPSLFLMTCLDIFRGERKRGMGREALLLIPAAVLALLVMTNDLHLLVYRPKAGLDEFYVVTGTYTYGPVFYLMYVWMGLMLLAGIVLLFLATRKRAGRGTLPLAAELLLWVGMVLITELVFSRYNIRRMYNMPEIHIFGFLGLLEICIRLRLIPHNENYAGFFAGMEIPAVIAGKTMTPVYRSAETLKLTAEQMTAALRGHVYLDPDTRLSGREVTAGAVFWTEDERTLHRLNRRLEDANETLSLENDLIRYETEQREERARIEARSAIYARAAAEVYPAQRKIAALLDGVRPDTPAFTEILGQVCVLNAYVKRKTNFILSGAERISGNELYLALNEMIRFLHYSGVTASAEHSVSAEFSYGEALDLYDSFQILTEILTPRITKLLVYLQDGGVRMAADCGPLDGLPETPLPVETEYADQLLYLTVRTERGGGG